MKSGGGEGLTVDSGECVSELVGSVEGVGVGSGDGAEVGVGVSVGVNVGGVEVAVGVTPPGL